MHCDVRYYNKGDLFAIEPLYDDYILSDQLDRVFREYPTYTFYSDTIHIIAGTQKIWDGIYNLTVVPGKTFPANQKMVEEQLRVILALHMHENNIRKLYTIVHSIKPKHIRWAEKFGFKNEYTMKNAGPTGADVFGYSLVQEDL